jgi:hypothetical protein
MDAKKEREVDDRLQHLEKEAVEFRLALRALVEALEENHKLPVLERGDWDKVLTKVRARVVPDQQSKPLS